MQEMSKEKLRRYRMLLSEIELLKRQLDKIEPEFVIDSVQGSSAEFPYTSHKVKIEGYDLDTYKKRVARLNNRIINKMNELIEEKEILVEFICSIENTEIRQIFIYKYLDGLLFNDIAKKMSFGTSTVRLKHHNFLKKLKD